MDRLQEPQVKDAPKELNKGLENAYSRCMAKHHDATMCSKIAWDVAKKTGWHKSKDGKWTKEKETTVEPLSSF